MLRPSEFASSCSGSFCPGGPNELLKVSLLAYSGLLPVYLPRLGYIALGIGTARTEGLAFSFLDFSFLGSFVLSLVRVAAFCFREEERLYTSCAFAAFLKGFLMYKGKKIP